MNEFLRGVLIGLTVAIPVGPMAVLTIRKSLLRGWPSGVAFGTGIALADVTYASIAAGGFATIEAALSDNISLIRIIGGFLMIGIGIMIMRSGKDIRVDSDQMVASANLRREIASGYLLALSNPPTVLIFLALLAGFGATFAQSPRQIPFLVLGVFIGSAGWWTFMSAGTEVIRRRLTPGWIHRANLIAGGVIALFGLMALVLEI